MKTLIRRLARVRHAVIGNVLMGVILVVAGAIQYKNALYATPEQPAEISPTALMVAGAFWILLSAVTLVATYRVEPVLEGEIVVLQQPQLPDVQVHTHRTKELAQAS